ncbi:hypothetical protein [Acidianus sp. HS-5]|uniref:hypothetical protein n=1 Tax=Acidianus sp. HS-5 TaxID=2886040 RepID=UPI001F25873C|nr:hypothetical protein [Acidianus sp. HS-5]BDC17976.1 hypothetical protein HS5_08660 [Acidianus sp. HS-5]
MKTVGLVVFIIVLAIELAFTNALNVLNQGISQISDINIFNQPKFAFFTHGKELEVCVNNTENFPIIICVIKGKEIILCNPQTIPSLTARNITLIISNYHEFETNLRNEDCVVFIKLHFLNVTFCTSEKI